MKRSFLKLILATSITVLGSLSFSESNNSAGQFELQNYVLSTDGTATAGLEKGTWKTDPQNNIVVSFGGRYSVLPVQWKFINNSLHIFDGEKSLFNLSAESRPARPSITINPQGLAISPDRNKSFQFTILADLRINEEMNLEASIMNSTTSILEGRVYSISADLIYFSFGLENSLLRHNLVVG